MVFSTPPVRSPLTLLVLALLSEHPMHVYGLHKLIRDRGQTDLVNVEHRNSIRQSVERLTRDGLAEVAEVQAGGGPQRTVHRVTDAGRTALLAHLRDLLRTPRREYPVFPVVVSLMAFLPPSEASELLAERRAELTADRARIAAATRSADLPPVLLIENDLRVRLIAAEIEWVDDTLGQIASGGLSWDPATLLADSPMAALLREESGP